MASEQVSVFSKDLREAAEVGTSTNVIGNYELHDLVQLEYVASHSVMESLKHNRSTASRLSVSSSKQKEIRSVFWTRMAKFVSCNLTKSQCARTHTELSQPIPKVIDSE